MSTASVIPAITGSILISGRRTGQVRLDLKGPEAVDFASTNLATYDDVLFDARQKLDEIKASPSPVESEIKFLETWLMQATLFLANKVLVSEAVSEAENVAHTGASGSTSHVTKQPSKSVHATQAPTA